MVRSPSILERNPFALTPSLSSTQAQVDSLVGRFVDEASSPTTLAALMAGGMAYRLGRIAVMGSGGGQVLNLPLRHTLSVAFGLGAEVTAFEFTNRLLYTIRATGQSPLPHLWSWSGPGGWAQGLSSSLVTFGLLRGAGVLVREQNLFFQHAFQSSAMVAGHQTSALFGITPRPEGSLAEQFLHAEVTNLQLGAGSALLHAVAPGVQALERSLDLAAREGRSLWAFPRPRENAWPPLAFALASERGSASPPKTSPRDPLDFTTTQMSMIGEGGEGSGPPAPVSSHIRRLITLHSESAQPHLHPPILEGGRNTLMTALEQPNLKPLIVEHLLNLEETYSPSSLSEYIFAMGYHTTRGRSPAEIIEILSERLNEGSEIQSFYRGLNRVELLVWRLAHEVVGRKSNQDKLPRIEEILSELKRQQGYDDLSERADGILERLKKEDPASIRISNDTLSEVIGLFHEHSMQHMFFSRQPSEAAAQFADIGGVLLRLDLPARLITVMNPMQGHHIAFQKSQQNLALLIHHFRPDNVYQGPEGREQALREAPPLPSAGVLSYRPAAELPLFIPAAVVGVVEAAYEHPPARHLKNQIWLGKTVKAIVQAFREGRGDFLESQSISLGRDPERAFEFLKGFK